MVHLAQLGVLGSDVTMTHCVRNPDAGSLWGGRLPERTNGAASKVVVASGSPWVRIPYLPRQNHSKFTLFHGIVLMFVPMTTYFGIVRTRVDFV